MKKDNIERRSATLDEYNREKNTVEGYAAVFDEVSTTLGFNEIIERGAITEATIANSDVFAVIDHNRDRILARSRYGKGSLKLEVDDKGLKYSFELPNTEVGNELRSHLERGEINSSSFAFTVASEEWEYNSEIALRRVKKIDYLYDCSPVYEPAYPNTDVALRSLEAIKKENEKMVEEKRKQTEKINNKIKIMRKKLTLI
jgi:HK97 family phage prohead protease